MSKDSGVATPLRMQGPDRTRPEPPPILPAMSGLVVIGRISDQVSPSLTEDVADERRMKDC